MKPKPQPTQPSALQIILPILIFTAVGIALWFAFPSVRSTNKPEPPLQVYPAAAPPTVQNDLLVPEENQPTAETEPHTTLSEPQLSAPGLNSYPQAEQAWGDIFNPQKSVPPKGYFAWYINTNSPREVVAHETVSSIAINYAYEQFHNIPSPTFGAYWAGRLHVPQRGVYRISGDFSHADVRIMLNRRIVADGSNNPINTTLMLEQGDYLLEAEYSNHWHTTRFQLTVAPDIKILDDAELTTTIASLHLPANTVAYAAGVYSSDNRDNRILLDAPAGNHPYILILDSYEAVQWQIIGRLPQLVIYSNSQRGSSVLTRGNIPLLAWNNSVSPDLSSSETPSCHCMPTGDLYCDAEETDLREFTNRIRQLTGYPLQGVSTQHSASRLSIPQTPIDAASLAISDRRQQDIERRRRICTSQTSRSVPGRIYAP